MQTTPEDAPAAVSDADAVPASAATPAPVMAVTTAQLIAFFARSHRIFMQQIAGLTHADSLLQPPYRGNCLNWVAGHIAVHRDYILLGLGAQPTLSETVHARYTYQSEPVLRGDDPSVVPFDTLVQAITTAQERIVAALEQASEAFLDEPVPFSPEETRGQLTTDLFWHEGYHVGQTEQLRQLTGTNDHVL